MKVQQFIKSVKAIVQQLSLKFEQFYYICVYNREHELYSQFKLNKQQIAEIDAVYKRFKKIKHFSHAFYTDKTGIFSPYYIPDGLHYAYIDHYFNDWKKGKIMDNKCEYYKMFPDIPQPETVCYRVNGIWFDSQHCPHGITPPYQQIGKYDKVFVKAATDSSGGSGVKLIMVKYLDKDAIDEQLIPFTGDVIIQVPIKQSSIMARLHPSSVNTLRIISLLDRNGQVKIYSSIVRMGVGDAVVDNASSGGITCGVNLNGRLKPVAYSAKGDKFDVHPTTKIHFDEIVVPNFEAAKKLVQQAHLMIPHFRLVSWDIAFDKKDQPLLLEANLHYGELDFHQLNNGPIFGDDTIKILEEVFSK